MGGKKMHYSDWIYRSCNGIEYHGIIEFELDTEIPKSFMMGVWRIAIVILSDLNGTDAEVYTKNYPSRFVFFLRDEDALVGLTVWLKDEDVAPGASIFLAIPEEYFNYQGLNPAGAPFLQASQPCRVVVGPEEE
jgi:hypothetical protein